MCNSFAINSELTQDTTRLNISIDWEPYFFFYSIIVDEMEDALMMCRASTTHWLKRDVILIRREQLAVNANSKPVTEDLGFCYLNYFIWYYIKSKKKMCTQIVFVAFQCFNSPPRVRRRAGGKINAGRGASENRYWQEHPRLEQVLGKKRSDKTVHFRGDPGSHGRWLTRGGRIVFIKTCRCVCESALFSPLVRGAERRKSPRRRW